MDSDARPAIGSTTDAARSRTRTLIWPQSEESMRNNRMPRLMITFLGMLLLPVVGQDPPIRHVPQTVDSPLAERRGLCSKAHYRGGASRVNDARLAVAQVLGP